MKILLLDEAYDPVIKILNSREPSRLQKSLHDLNEDYSNFLFPTSEYWKIPLEKLGNEVLSVTANDFVRQVKWALENGRSELIKMYCDGYVINDFYIPNLSERVSLKEAILLAQIEEFKPDLIVCGLIEVYGTEFLAKAKKRYEKFLAVGHHQAPPPNIDVTGYDLIVSSLPNLVEYYQSLGIKSRYLKLAADSRLLDLEQRKINENLTFFGSLGSGHSKRIQFFESIGMKTRVDIWTAIPKELMNANSSKLVFHSPLFGREMYIKMVESYISINFHIDVSGPYANNLRLYEVPACGAVLLTDEKRNLNEIFEIGKEVLTYESEDDFLRKVRQLTNEPEYRHELSIAGRARIKKDHTFTQRALELMSLITAI